jgi:hypothetical protein
VPELQVGQLSHGEVAPAPEPMLNVNEDSSLRGLDAWHPGGPPLGVVSRSKRPWVVNSRS